MPRERLQGPGGCSAAMALRGARGGMCVVVVVGGGVLQRIPKRRAPSGAAPGIPANLPPAPPPADNGARTTAPPRPPPPPSVPLLPPSPTLPPLSAFSSSSSPPLPTPPHRSRDSSESRKWPRGRTAAADARSGPPRSPGTCGRPRAGKEGGGRGALRRLRCPQGGVSPDRAVCTGRAGGAYRP